jgi:hypothetical protein
MEPSTRYVIIAVVLVVLAVIFFNMYVLPKAL